MDQAATPTGAESSARAEVSAPSVHDRIKAAIYGAPEKAEKPEQAAEPVAETTETESEAAPPKVEKPKEAKPKEKPAEEAEVETDDVDADAEVQLSSLNELAEATGLQLDKLLDLDIPTKIDGKEGKVRLRDLVKSHQLEGHLNQKLMTHAEEKKAFELEISNQRAQQQQKFMELNAAAQVAQKLLEGDVNGIDWAALEQSDPLTFNQEVVKFQRRQAQIQQITQQIAAERQQAEQQMAKQQQAYLADQQKQLDAKLPEWADKTTKAKEIAEMASVLNDSFGITEQELKSQVDHRLILVARAAMKWQQLEKARPAVLKKVTNAPRLLKPGVPQSKSAQEALVNKGARDRLRATGKVSDAKQVLKQILFR